MPAPRGADRAPPTRERTLGKAVRMIDGAGLRSGIHLLRVESEGQVRTKRVVMVRS